MKSKINTMDAEGKNALSNIYSHDQVVSKSIIECFTWVNTRLFELGQSKVHIDKYLDISYNLIKSLYAND